VRERTSSPYHLVTLLGINTQLEGKRDGLIKLGRRKGLQGLDGFAQRVLALGVDLFGRGAIAFAAIFLHTRAVRTTRRGSPADFG
jgi:hypothetical protein